MAESYSVPGNALKAQREEILGWAKQQLAEFARSELRVQLSSKTIERVERNQGHFSRITFTRLLQAVNAARQQQKVQLPPIAFNELFPTLVGKPKPAPPKKRK